jgi:hypothetical protein
MSTVDAQRQQQAKRYAKRLRRALNETGTTIYRLSRALNPERPDSARSNLQRYVAGRVLPGPMMRIEIAAALGRPELRDVDDDEEDALLALRRDPESLFGVLVDAIAERLRSTDTTQQPVSR